MDETSVEDRYALAERITNPETDTAWVSPVGVEESLEYLIELPDRYDTVEDGYRIADVGCGDGALTVALADRYPDADVTGIDIAPEYAKERVTDYREETGRDNANVVGGDIYDVLPALEPFDFAYAVNVLQDVPEFPSAVETITDATRDEAYVGATFTGENAKHLFGDFLQYDEEADAEFWAFEDIELDEDTTVSFRQRIISEEEAVETFRDYGFESVEHEELDADDRYLADALELLNPENDMDVADIEPSYPFILFHRGGA